jgi:hypothetical protein
MPPAATSTRSCASRRPVRSPQATAAKQVCAGCVVRGPCLEAALQGPQAHDDHTGIFTGTTAKDRVALRSRASMALGTRFMHDRAAAKAALALAKRSASTGPPGSWASPSRRCGVPSPPRPAPPQVFQGAPRRTPLLQEPRGGRTGLAAGRPGWYQPGPARNSPCRIGRCGPPGSATVSACPPPNRRADHTPAGPGVYSAQPWPALRPGTLR